MRIAFPKSHAYRGSLVSVDLADSADEARALVEFGDGATAIAECRPEGDTIRLAIPEYRTAGGTTVKARTWELRRSGQQWRSYRIS